MVRFIHTADWQIGEAFQFLGERSVNLRDARFEAVGRIAEFADEQAVDFVLVAGDVFEFAHPDRVSIRRLADQFARFAGLWLLLPGNHDPAVPYGTWDQLAESRPLGTNVVLLVEPQPFVIDELEVAILPAPLRARYAGRDLTDDFQRMTSPPGYYRIGVAHGTVTGVLPDGAEVNNPIARDRAELASLDYLALGDWHGSVSIGERTFYSGTPETDRFTKNDSGAFNLVDIDAPGALPQVTRVPVSRFQWHEHQATLTGAADLAVLEGQLGAFGSDDVLKVVLRGHLSFEEFTQLRELEEGSRARVHTLVWDASSVELAPSDAELAFLKMQGIGGLVLQRLLAKRDSMSPAVFRRCVIELMELGEVR